MKINYVCYYLLNYAVTLISCNTMHLLCSLVGKTAILSIIHDHNTNRQSCMLEQYSLRLTTQKLYVI